MPISRRFVSQNEEECQILKMDSSSPFIVNDCEEWQFLFGPSSELSNSGLQIKLAAQFNTESFDGIKVIAYLYEPSNGLISSLGDCTFTVYKVVSPNWQDELIGSFVASVLPNSYFYKELTTTDLLGNELDGETTLMIEASGTRLGSVYRDRIYINHLGIYDSVLRLKKEVDFLSITKEDE